MLQKIGFLPGFNKQVTPTGGEFQWQGGANVRFRYGTPEKIGGWEQLGDDSLIGAARAQHHLINNAELNTLSLERIEFYMLIVVGSSTIFIPLNLQQLKQLVLKPSIILHQLL